MHSKGNHHQNERRPPEWENIFTDMPDKGLIFKILKNLQNSTPKKQTIQLKMGKGHEKTLLQRGHTDGQ